MEVQIQALNFKFYKCRIHRMNIISKAVELSGGPTKLAAILGVSPQAVCFWRDGQRELPHKHGPKIEQATGFKVTGAACKPAAGIKLDRISFINGCKALMRPPGRNKKARVVRAGLVLVENLNALSQRSGFAPREKGLSVVDFLGLPECLNAV